MITMTQSYIKCIEKKIKSFLLLFFLLISMYHAAISMGLHPAVRFPFECYAGMAIGYIVLGAFIDWFYQEAVK